MIKINRLCKIFISIAAVMIFCFVNAGSLGITANAAKTYSIKITYIGKPTETTGDWVNSALKVKFDVKGYGGTKLRLQICNSDGIEIYTALSKEIGSDDWWVAFYWGGKDSKGNRYPDGNYYVSYWIEGSQRDTEATKYYKLDFKGNDTVKPATTKSYVCTYMGQPKNPDSDYYGYAFQAVVNVKGYKGKTLKAWLYDPYGDHCETFSMKIGSDDYNCNFYYNGYDFDDLYSGDGKYIITVWIDGENTSKSWNKDVTLKKSS